MKKQMTDLVRDAGELSAVCRPVGRMGCMTTASPDPLALQATLVDFALAELVRQHRQSFQPLWSAESWAKLLIWLALNCGCSGDRDSLEAYAEALGVSSAALEVSRDWLRQGVDQAAADVGRIFNAFLP